MLVQETAAKSPKSQKSHVPSLSQTVPICRWFGTGWKALMLETKGLASRPEVSQVSHAFRTACQYHPAVAGG